VRAYVEAEFKRSALLEAWFQWVFPAKEATHSAGPETTQGWRVPNAVTAYAYHNSDKAVSTVFFPSLHDVL